MYTYSISEKFTQAFSAMFPSLKILMNTIFFQITTDKNINKKMVVNYVRSFGNLLFGQRTLALFGQWKYSHYKNVLSRKATSLLFCIYCNLLFFHYTQDSLATIKNYFILIFFISKSFMLIHQRIECLIKILI